MRGQGCRQFAPCRKNSHYGPGMPGPYKESGSAFVGAGHAPPAASLQPPTLKIVREDDRTFVVLLDDFEGLYFTTPRTGASSA